MRRSMTVIGFFIGLPGWVPSHADEILVAHALGKSYSIKITDEVLKKTPLWDGKAENPPLSARKAIELATESKSKLVKDSEYWKWDFMSIGVKRAALHSNGGRWYWVAYFLARSRLSAGTGQPQSLYVVVLMNGTVIRPVIKDDR